MCAPSCSTASGRAFSGGMDTWKSIVAYTTRLRGYARRPGGPRTGALCADHRLRGREPAQGRPRGCETVPEGVSQGRRTLRPLATCTGRRRCRKRRPGGGGYFGRVLVEQPDSTMRAEITFLLGNAQFAQGEIRRGGEGLPQVPERVQGWRAHRGRDLPPRAVQPVRRQLRGGAEAASPTFLANNTRRARSRPTPGTASRCATVRRAGLPEGASPSARIG